MSQQSPIRIVVADGHPLFTLGVRALLAREPGFEVVGDADDGEDALAVLEKHRPDVLLLDLALSGINGLEVLRRMVAMDLPTRTVIVTAAIDRADLRTALMRGAQGVLLKHLASDLLVKCVRQIMIGDTGSAATASAISSTPCAIRRRATSHRCCRSASATS